MYIDMRSIWKWELAGFHLDNMLAYVTLYSLLMIAVNLALNFMKTPHTKLNEAIVLPINIYMKITT